MAKIDLKLGKSKKEKYTKTKHYENNYKYWREHRKSLKQPFFMVPSEILHYLSSINSKAVNLYLYYCYRAGNDTGKSWASVERSADDLGISTKSVNNWNKELEALGLILRLNEGKSSKTTYLLPISDYCYLEEELTPETFIDFSNKKIDGELKAVLHLFQWRKEELTDFTKPYNVTCLIFQRSYETEGLGEDKKNFVITKAVFFEEDEYKEMSINKNNEDFSNDQQGFIFEIEKRSYAEAVETKGIALTSKIDLKGMKKSNEVIDLIQQLVKGLEDGTLGNLPEAEVVV